MMGDRPGGVWRKFRNMSAGAKALAVAGAAMLLLLVAAAAILIILHFFFGDDPKYFSNNAAVALEGGRVVIYQAELGADRFDRPPGATMQFAILSTSANTLVWDLKPVKKRGGNVCSDAEIERALGKVTYGITPKCFHDSKDGAPQPLESGTKYIVFRGNKTGKQGSAKVYFMLSRCASSRPGCMILKTNSPATEEIKRNVERTLRGR